MADHELTRRGLGAGVAGAAASGFSPSGPAFAAAGAGAQDLRAIQHDLDAYDAFGSKRSGGPGDEAVLAWMDRRLATLGFRLERQTFETPFLDHDHAFIIIDGATLPALAQAPLGVTAPEGLEATLAVATPALPEVDVGGKIVLVLLDHARHSHMNARLIAQAHRYAAAGARALILATTGPSREAVLLNVPETLSFSGLPLLVVGAASARALIEASQRGATIRVFVSGATGKRPASNLIARRDGAGATLVVTTPRSGWTHCTGERGPGVAIFLALAQGLSAARRAPPLLFVATSGHEFENLGARRFLDEIAPPANDTRLWLHLGAGLASFDRHEPSLTKLPTPDAQRYLMASPALMPAVERAFRGLPGLERVYPTTEEAAGETAEILARGYRSVIGAFAAHRFHHAMADRSDHTSAQIVAPVAAAFQRALNDILSA